MTIDRGVPAICAAMTRHEVEVRAHAVHPDLEEPALIDLAGSGTPPINTCVFRLNRPSRGGSLGHDETISRLPMPYEVRFPSGAEVSRPVTIPSRRSEFTRSGTRRGTRDCRGVAVDGRGHGSSLGLTIMDACNLFLTSSRTRGLSL